MQTLVFTLQQVLKSCLPKPRVFSVGIKELILNLYRKANEIEQLKLLTILKRSKKH